MLVYPSRSIWESQALAHAPIPYLPVQKVPLRDIVLHWLRASTAASDGSAASLQETLHACNKALDRAAECIAQAPAAAWGWPPPETCDGSEIIPAAWGQQESQSRLKAALDRLQLPPLSGKAHWSPLDYHTHSHVFLTIGC
jgi:hypothetical protein